MWLIRTKVKGGANANIILQRLKVSTTASDTTAFSLDNYYQDVEISKDLLLSNWYCALYDRYPVAYSGIQAITTELSNLIAIVGRRTNRSLLFWTSLANSLAKLIKYDNIESRQTLMLLSDGSRWSAFDTLQRRFRQLLCNLASGVCIMNEANPSAVLDTPMSMGHCVSIGGRPLPNDRQSPQSVLPVRPLASLLPKRPCKFFPTRVLDVGGLEELGSNPGQIRASVTQEEGSAIISYYANEAEMSRLH